MSELQNENHNDPSKRIEEARQVVPSCGHCKTAPAQIATNGMQMGPLICQLFFCGTCGAIFNVFVVAKQEMDPRLAGGILIGGGRI